MEILYPMFGMIFVTAMVMMLLYISRIQALSKRSTNPKRLPNEVARHSDEIRKYMTPRNRFITENQPIEPYLCADKGVELMAIDGRITTHIINHFTAKQIPILTVLSLIHI